MFRNILIGLIGAAALIGPSVGRAPELWINVQPRGKSQYVRPLRGSTSVLHKLRQCSAPARAIRKWIS